MSEKEKQIVTIDDQKYALETLPDAAKTQLMNLRFVDERMIQLRSELAISDTARMAYVNALKREVAKIRKD